MTLIDEARALAIYERLGAAIECSGGSAANTIAGLASFGARTAFTGKTRNDQLGDVFGHDIRALGVNFSTLQKTDGPATARCLVVVTPDAQRSMATYLGASVSLAPADIDPELVAAAKVTYLEGYLWDPPQAKEAFLVAMDIAHAAGNKVALSLSDAFCVDRYRAEFRNLVDKHIDVLFANEQEILSLYEVAGFEAAVAAVRGSADVAVLTRGDKGAVIVTENDVLAVPAAAVANLVDTTGAGDLYAAGFLHGLTRGLPLGECGRLAGLAAAEVISHYGARPEISLKTLV
nr:adenosine kinase [Govania unica]